MTTGDPPSYECGCINWGQGHPRCLRCFPVAIMIHDEFVLDLKNIDHVQKKITEALTIQEKLIMPVITVNVATWSDCVIDAKTAEAGSITGRISYGDTNLTGYPRELDEELCLGCAQKIEIRRHNACAPEWKAYHIIPNPDGDRYIQYYCRREFHQAKKVMLAETEGYPNGPIYMLPEPKQEAPVRTLEFWYRFVESVVSKQGRKSFWSYSNPTGFNEILLGLYEKSQRELTDYQPAKRLLEAAPEASVNWSAALRVKILESEDKEKDRRYATENAFWDPYGDGED